MKKTVLLLVIIFVLGAGWAAGWFFVANTVEQALETGKTRLASQDKIFQCPNQEINGFPFRINLTCAETTYIDNAQGFSFEAGELRSAAQAYQPGKAVVEVDGPAVMVVGSRDTYDLKWDTLRASFTAGLSGVETFSSVGTKVTVKPANPIQEPFVIENFQAHSRKAEVNDVDMALLSTGIASQNALWPEFDLTLNVRFADVYDALLKNPDLKKITQRQGLSGQITELKYVSEAGGNVTVTGPLEVDTNGLLSGKFKVKVTQLQLLIQSMGQAFPQNQELFQQIGIAAGLLGGGQNGGQLELPITIRRGQANLGLIPIGSVPPVF